MHIQGLKAASLGVVLEKGVWGGDQSCNATVYTLDKYAKEGINKSSRRSKGSNNEGRLLFLLFIMFLMNSI